MGYQLVLAAPDGRHVVESPETGQRYRRTPARDWPEDLASWRDSLDTYRGLLDRLAKRAAQRNCWDLYHRAKRAAYSRQLPCPMPWGHVMFRGIKRTKAGSNVPAVGMRVTVHGTPCRIFKVRPAGTIDVVSLDGRRAWRLTGLMF